MILELQDVFLCTRRGNDSKKAFQWICEDFVTYLGPYVLWQLHDIKKNDRIFIPRGSWVMHGKEKHENREFNLLVSKTKYFPLLDWSSQIENAAKTKKMSHFLLLSVMSGGCLLGVPLRFWIKRLLMSGEELSPQPWQLDFCDGWGNVGKLDLFLSLFFTSGLKQSQLWGTKSWSWFSLKKRSFGVT